MTHPTLSDYRTRGAHRMLSKCKDCDRRTRSLRCEKCSAKRLEAARFKDRTRWYEARVRGPALAFIERVERTELAEDR